jgi:hypothetical protein
VLGTQQVQILPFGPFGIKKKFQSQLVESADSESTYIRKPYPHPLPYMLYCFFTLFISMKRIGRSWGCGSSDEVLT